MTMRYTPIEKRRLKPRRPPGPSFPAQRIIDEMKKVLGNHREGATLSQLAREADIRWETATKYTKLLEARKEVTTQQVGHATLVRLKD